MIEKMSVFDFECHSCEDTVLTDEICLHHNCLACQEYNGCCGSRNEQFDKCVCEFCQVFFNHQHFVIESEDGFQMRVMGNPNMSDKGKSALLELGKAALKMQKETN